jgi:hypothetical protein
MRKRSWSLNQLDEIIVLQILWGGRPRVSTTFVSGCSANGNLLLACWSRCAGKEGMVEPIDGDYRMEAVVRHDIETIFQSDQLSFDPSMWG